MFKFVPFFALLSIAVALPAPNVGLFESSPAVAAVVPHATAYVAPQTTAYAGPYATAYSGLYNYGYNSIYNHPYHAVQEYAPYFTNYNTIYKSAVDYPHLTSTYAAHPYNYVY